MDPDIKKVIELAGVKPEDITDRIYILADHHWMLSRGNIREAAAKLRAQLLREIL